MLSPKKLILFDSFLLVPDLMLHSFLKVFRKVFATKPNGNHKTVIIKFLGAGNLIKYARQLKIADVNLTNCLFITFKQHQQLCQVLGFQNVYYVKPQFPITFFLSLLKCLFAIKKFKPDCIINLEKEAHFTNILTIICSLLTRSFIIGFTFKPKGYKNKFEKIISLYLKTQNECLEESVNFISDKKKRVNGSEIEVNNSKILININASNYLYERRYPLSGYYQLIQKLVQFNPTYKIYLTGSQAERNYCNELVAMFKKESVPLYNVAGDWSIEQFTIELASCSFFVSNDSGPMHLAAYLQIPSIIIWGPTNENQIGYPELDFFYNVSLKLPCRPCFKGPRSKIAIECQGKISCMNDLTIDLIWKHVLKITRESNSIRTIIIPPGMITKIVAKKRSIIKNEIAK